MGHEQILFTDEDNRPIKEFLDPHHFYAAYVFDNAGTRQRDLAVLIDQAQQLGYPVRYWWLSEAMDLQSTSDRLIVCVHHPSLAEDAGMDLYNTLRQAATKHEVTWDALESATVDEYRQFGKITVDPDSIFEPDGTPLFPEAETELDLLFTLTKEDVQYVAQAMLGRDLNDDEMKVVAEHLPGALDWIGAMEVTIKIGLADGTIGSGAEGHETLKRERPRPETQDVALTATREDIQSVAEGVLGRALTDAEFKAVAAVLPQTFDWYSSVHAAIEACQRRGKVGLPQRETSDDEDGKDRG